MCEPATLLAIASVGSAAMGYQQANQAADAAEVQRGIARQGSIDEQGQLSVRNLQEAEAATQQRDLIARDADIAGGRAAAGMGGQLGTGGAYAGTLNEIAGTASAGRYVVGRNLSATQDSIKAQQRAIGTRHLLQAPITRPSLLGAILQAGVGAVGAYAAGKEAFPDGWGGSSSTTPVTTKDK